MVPDCPLPNSKLFPMSRYFYCCWVQPSFHVTSDRASTFSLRYDSTDEDNYLESFPFISSYDCRLFPPALPLIIPFPPWFYSCQIVLLLGTMCSGYIDVIVLTFPHISSPYLFHSSSQACIHHLFFW